MNNVSESIIVASSPPIPTRWSIWSRDGVFYATVPMLGDDSFFEIALHGISSEPDAHQALAAFTRLPGIAEA